MRPARLSQCATSLRSRRVDGGIGIDPVRPDDIEIEAVVDADDLGRCSILADLVRLHHRGVDRRLPIEEISSLAAKTDRPAAVLMRERELTMSRRWGGHVFALGCSACAHPPGSSAGSLALSFDHATSAPMAAAFVLAQTTACAGRSSGALRRRRCCSRRPRGTKRFRHQLSYAPSILSGSRLADHAARSAAAASAQARRMRRSSSEQPRR